MTLAVSPDHSLIVTRYLWINGHTETANVNRSIVMHAVTETWSDRRLIYISTPGLRQRSLRVFLSNLPAIYIYDTQTWRQVDSLPGLPSGGVAYYPSTNWKHGVVISAADKAELWNATATRTLATLDLDGKFENVFLTRWLAVRSHQRPSE